MIVQKLLLSQVRSQWVECSQLLDFYYFLYLSVLVLLMPSVLVPFHSLLTSLFMFLNLNVMSFLSCRCFNYSPGILSGPTALLQASLSIPLSISITYSTLFKYSSFSWADLFHSSNEYNLQISELLLSSGRIVEFCVIDLTIYDLFLYFRMDFKFL